MSLLGYFPGKTLSDFLRRSNYWAMQNRNSYPVKIHKAISDLYDWIDCPCDNGCDCKKYQCEKHLVRKPDIDFNIFHRHFLECFVDFRAHDAVSQGRISGRGYRAVEATRRIRDDWGTISCIPTRTHLLCSNWREPEYEVLADFKPNNGTIYRAKWLSILFFDTFVAYDTTSVALLNRDFKKPPYYLTLIERIRQEIIAHLEKTGCTLQAFRRYDNPSEFFDEIPKESPRPLGDIIDKLYLTL